MANTKNSTSDGIDHLDGASADITAQRLAAIKAVLPEAFDLDGNLVRDKLLEALKPASYEPSDDIPAFGLAWPGKQSAFAAAGVPTTATLRPCPDQSVDFDTTRNLLIEGDNLEVLKTLQRSYHGKVKMIYIDPPYNTGKDFVYPDNYGEGLDTYLQRTQQKDEDGFWKSTNSETSGRKHANWLSMMAPRLTLARNLLRDDGVIFISIDDNEVANLRMLCDEVFGAENFVGELVHQRAKGGGQAKYLVRGHDYILVYAKKLSPAITLKREKVVQAELVTKDGVQYILNDDIVRKQFGKYDKSLGDRRCFYDELEQYKGVEKKKEVDAKLESGELFLRKNAEGRQVICRLEPLDEAYSKMYSIIRVLSEEGKKDLDALKITGFDYPKPVELLKILVHSVLFTGESDGIALDFFAGSGTTGHAVMAQNAEDGGNRRYICAQLPEPLEEPVTLDDGVVCETIFHLTRERLRRAGAKIKDDAGLNAEQLDTGLRVFKLDSSNFTAWNSEPTTGETDLLDRLNQINDQTVPGRSETDILWEMLLKMGLPLDIQLERFELEGAAFIGVAERTKVISTETSIPTAAMEALLDQDIPPSELVVLDSAFADDSARANIATLYRERKDEDGKPICNLRVV